MDWVCKGLLTAGVVTLVLFAARGWGNGVAGWLAGLPVTTAPMLAWVSVDHGTGFAADAAVASVAACGTLAVVALSVALALARRRRAAMVAGATVLAFGLLLPWLAAHGGLAAAVAVALSGCALALGWWPRPIDVAVRPASVANSWRTVVVTSIVAGTLSIVASAVGPSLGMATAGWLAALPVVSASVAVSQAAAGGPATIVPFLHGYVLGLIGRIAFGVALVVGLSHASFPIALAGACAVAMACHVAVAMACRMAVAMACRMAVATTGLGRLHALRTLAACPSLPPTIGLPARSR